MITKTLFATAAVATLAAGLAAPAEAKVKFDLYIDGPGYPGYYDPYYPTYPVYQEPRRRHHRNYEEYDDQPRYGLSCDEGLQQVSYAGFRKIRVVECSGKSYTYKGRRHGEPFIVKVSSRSGRIISVQEAW